MDHFDVALTLLKPLLETAIPHIREHGGRRIECKTLADRSEMHDLLQLLGFQTEGVLRSYGTKGEDYFQYAYLLDLIQATACGQSHNHNERNRQCMMPDKPVPGGPPNVTARVTPLSTPVQTTARYPGRPQHDQRRTRRRSCPLRACVVAIDATCADERPLSPMAKPKPKGRPQGRATAKGCDQAPRQLPPERGERDIRAASARFGALVRKHLDRSTVGHYRRPQARKNHTARKALTVTRTL